MTGVCQLISRGGGGWQKKNRGKTKSFLCFAAAFMPLPGKSFYWVIKLVEGLSS